MKKSLAIVTLALTAGQSVLLQAQSSLPVPVVERSPVVRSTAQRQDQRISAATVRPVAMQATATAASLSSAAELLMLVEQLQDEVRYLRGQVEEQAHQMKKMRTDQRDRYRDLDRRISSLNRQLSEVGSVSTPAVGRPSAELGGTGNAALDSSEPAPTPTPKVSDRDAYQQAFSLVRQRAYDQSLQAFDDFLRFYPDSSLVPNALYWSGEVHRAKSKPDQAKARDAYLRLVEQFPSHQKAADGYYKLGLTYESMGEHAQAQAMMKKVISLYPEQASAKLAKEFLGNKP